MPLCGEMDGDFLFNCDDPIQGGTEDEMLVVNKDDIQSVTVDPTDLTTVTGVALKTGKKAFIIDGRKNSIVPTFALVESGVFDVFDHTVNAKGFDLSNTARVTLNKMVGGKYIVFTKNIYSGADGNAKYVISGLKSGLELSGLTGNPTDDTQGAFDITFGTRLNKEPKVPASMFDTDEATTEAIWESLKVVAP